MKMKAARWPGSVGGEVAGFTMGSSRSWGGMAGGTIREFCAVVLYTVISVSYLPDL